MLHSDSEKARLKRRAKKISHEIGWRNLVIAGAVTSALVLFLPWPWWLVAAICGALVIILSR